MDNVLIYVCYDPLEYVNYYSVAINGEVVCNFIPEEKIGEIFEKCDELNLSKYDTRWCIVQDVNAARWDYEKTIISYGYKINPMSISLSALTADLNSLFDNEFVIEPNCDTEKKIVNVLYPSFFVDEGIIKTSEKAVKDAEGILVEAGMTELAKIVREKYERMNRDE